MPGPRRGRRCAWAYLRETDAVPRPWAFGTPHARSVHPADERRRGDLVSGVRWYLQLANEARHLGLHALADWYMRLAHVSAGS